MATKKRAKPEEGKGVHAAQVRLDQVAKQFPWWGWWVSRAVRTFEDAPGRHLSTDQQVAMLMRDYPNLWQQGKFQVSEAPDRDRNQRHPALPFQTQVELPNTDDLAQRWVGGLELGYTYTNANWIGFHDLALPSPRFDRRYIATQAPLGRPHGTRADTRADFWLMVYYYRCKSILMLTPFDEHISHKAEPYFPDRSDSSVIYYAYSAKDLRENQPNDPPQWRVKVTIICTHDEREHLAGDVWVEKRMLYLTFTQAPDRPMGSHQVVHYHYLSWPDGSIPHNPSSIVALLKRSELRGSPDAPVVVHCSAGHGRTGTMLSAMMSVDSMRRGTALSQPTVTSHYLTSFLNVRASRWYTVSTVLQLLFGLEVFVLWLRDTHGLELEPKQIYDEAIMQINAELGSSLESPKIRCVQCYIRDSTVQCAHPHVTGSTELLPFCSHACSEAFCQSEV